MNEVIASQRRPLKIDAPARHTAGASKMAPKLSSDQAIAAFDPAKIQRCPAPVFGAGGRCYVDPASVPRFRYGAGGA